MNSSKKWQSIGKDQYVEIGLVEESISARPGNRMICRSISC